MAHERYYQHNGHYTLVNDDGTETVIGVGFAGNDFRPDTNKTGIKGYNNPAAQFIRYVGPLPCGWYTKGAAIKHAKLGPNTIYLTPDPTNDMRGRNAFYIHSPSGNPALVAQSSEGCICLYAGPRAVVVANTLKGITRLEVVA